MREPTAQPEPAPSAAAAVATGALTERLAVARAAAAAGARVLAEHRGRLTSISWKGARDLVTSADLASEQLVIDTLVRAFPDDQIIGEEGGRAEHADADWVWYVDPLDGTTNFVHGLPHFAVSIGATFRGAPVVGVIAAPALGTTWYGARGLGAFRVDGADAAPVPLAVSATTELGQSLVATGFPYDRAGSAEALVGPVRRALENCLCVRRLGSASLDLAYVAQGSYGAYWEPHLKPWDIAAGVALVGEAGGRVSDLAGVGALTTAAELWRGDIVASNGHLHEALLREVIRGAA